MDRVDTAERLVEMARSLTAAKKHRSRVPGADFDSKQLKVVAERPGKVYLLVDKKQNGLVYDSRKGKAYLTYGPSALARGYWKDFKGNDSKIVAMAIQAFKTKAKGSKKAAEGEWEAPEGRRKSWRRGKPGAYEYRKSAPGGKEEPTQEPETTPSSSGEVGAASRISTLESGDAFVVNGKIVDEVREPSGMGTSSYDGDEFVKKVKGIYSTMRQIKDQRIKVLAEKHGVSEDEVKQKSKEVLTGLLGNSRVCARVPQEALSQILESGRMMNQFETGTSGGTFEPEARKTTEAMALGVNMATSAQQRPVYGYMSDVTDEDSTRSKYGYGAEEDPSGIMDENIAYDLEQYGDVRLTFKRDVVEKDASVTLGDSLQLAGVYDMQSGFGTGHEEWATRMATSLSDPSIDMVDFDEFDPFDPPSNLEELGAPVAQSGPFPYTEVQFPAELAKLENVERIDLMSNMAGDDTVKLMFALAVAQEQYGFSIFLDGEDWSNLGQEKAASTQESMMEKEQVAQKLLELARTVVAAEEEEAEDPNFRSRVMAVKSKMNSLTPKKKKKLSQFDIPRMQPSQATVEDLVNALGKVLGV